MTLSLQIAQACAARAQQHALAMNKPVVIAVVDAGGHLVSLLRMDDAPVGSVEVAQAKARCAAQFKRPTLAFAERVAKHEWGVVTLPGVVAVAGGVPIVTEGEVIGAIGVSGGTPAQDHEIGAAGLVDIVGLNS